MPHCFLIGHTICQQCHIPPLCEMLNMVTSVHCLSPLIKHNARKCEIGLVLYRKYHICSAEHAFGKLAQDHWNIHLLLYICSVTKNSGADGAESSSPCSSLQRTGSSKSSSSSCNFPAKSVRAAQQLRTLHGPRPGFAQSLCAARCENAVPVLQDFNRQLLTFPACSTQNILEKLKVGYYDVESRIYIVASAREQFMSCNWKRGEGFRKYFKRLHIQRHETCAFASPIGKILYSRQN